MNDIDVLDQQYETGVAIIGMAGRFPGARNVDEFWQNLRNGVESISFFSDQEAEAAGVPTTLIRHPNYVKAWGILSDMELFDADFFGFNHREAELMDPQQRLFLECAWEALECAGYNPEIYKGRIGVYAGVSLNTYALFNLYPLLDLSSPVGSLQALIASDKDHLSTRVSYKLNLKGPSITVQTACSTSLVSTHLAWQALLNGECDMTLVGGVSVNARQKAGYFYQEGMIYSPDGHCRAFDAKAQGTVSGSGVGIVVLKRLADALADGDRIYAVIKGSAINNDGSAKVGYMAPSIDGQSEVIAEALAMARIDPETITYVETHGTGTSLGDPLEIAALTQVFRFSGKKNTCAVGSVKTNVGHLDAAAGVTGLIKTVLALEHKEIPPSLHFEQPNPKIDFANSPFYVNATLAEWQTDGTPRRAGVSSFGIGGTNAHIVLEEAPAIEPSSESRTWQLLVLSAKTASALEKATENLVVHLKHQPDLNLADVAYTLQVGRRPFNYRRAVVCQGLADATAALETLAPERVFTRFQEPTVRTVTFMFPGQGAQYVHMGSALYQGEPVFRKQVNRCLEILSSRLSFDLRQVMCSDDAELETSAQLLERTKIAQPALFVIEYALAKLWMEWGVYPHAMIGHSVGEYVAACLAGVFSLEDGLSLVTARSGLMQGLPSGSMLAVSLSEEEIRSLMDEHVSLAAVNAPSLCTVSGPTEAIEALQTRLVAQDIHCRRLHTSHAFHSRMMDSIVEPFAQLMEAIDLKPPQIPYVSNVTGTWVTTEEATSPEYWARHLRQTVRFSDGVHLLWQELSPLFLEVGPGRTLSSLVNQKVKHIGECVVLSSLPHPRDRSSSHEFLLNTLGQLWATGAQINWFGLYTHERRHRTALPTYPFERERYWIEPPTGTSQVISQQLDAERGLSQDGLGQLLSSSPHQRPNLLNPYVAPRNDLEEAIAIMWQEFLGVDQVGIHDDFYALGGHSLIATQIISRLQSTFPIELPLLDLFEALTVARMSRVIENALVGKIEELSEEEVQNLVHDS